MPIKLLIHPHFQISNAPSRWNTLYICFEIRRVAVSNANYLILVSNTTEINIVEKIEDNVRRVFIEYVGPTCLINPSYMFIDLRKFGHPAQLFHPARLFTLEILASLHNYSILHDYLGD